MAPCLSNPSDRQVLCIAQVKANAAVRDLGNQISHVTSKTLFNFALRYAAVLDHITKKGGDSEVLIRLGDRSGDQMGDFEKMVDVRFGGGSLPFLSRVLFGGEVGGA